MSNENLIVYLYNFLSTAKLDHYSITTYEWSKGYRKAIVDVINFIENGELKEMNNCIQK